MPRRTRSAITQPATRPPIWDLLRCPPCEIEDEVGAEELDDVDVAVEGADEEEDYEEQRLELKDAELC